ncbi:GGDEF domain-containing protein [Paenibacillus abyssi]|uniref:GGDEF domain-containing protein n=1 Tax=Paenibacillus abyssi TaxID=1340531 RepID=A0A917CYN8_9BACL|nr:GGDEF domain-containing protein [Paenibacillus abyssi]GGG01868.1 hypothetical protein GCM10010916_18780 [Paenibacillus abyssi]
MKYTGRVVVISLFISVIAVWTILYFLIVSDAGIYLPITNGFLQYSFGYTILIVPILWWLGKQYDKAKYLTERDDLTGAYNRRYLLDRFGEIKPASLSLSIIDVNDFKMINDTYGHHLGDEVLRDVLTMLRYVLNKEDIVVRVGGDEFLVISESHCLLSQQIDFDLDNNMRVSVSVGTAVYPEQATTLNQLLQVADNNMYRIKKRKR